MSNEKSDSQQWFLRIAGGTIFGPVSLKGLVAWAEQGRIVPGHQVSSDREHWLAADGVPELEMRWFVDVGGGKTVGPFNRTAAENILKTGKAPAGAKLVAADQVAPAAAPAAQTAATPAAETPAVPTHAVAARRAEDAPATAEGREDRIQKLELALEKQREAVSMARQAAKTQATLEEERDELRQQMHALREQMESLRANAEKDARARERRLETLRQELTRLQQAQAQARSQPALTLIPVEEEEAPTPDPVEALEALQRSVADERRNAERNLETLRARVQSLEQTLADSRQAEAAARTAAAAAQTALTALEAQAAEAAAQQAQTLQRSLAERDAAQETVRQEAEALRTRAETAEARIIELASTLGQRETECRKLSADREVLQQQLGMAMSTASDATNDSETACAALQRRLDQFQAVIEGLRTQLAEADRELDAERLSKADLLATANSRDAANQQRIAEQEARQEELEANSRNTGTPTERETRLAADLAQARARIAELQSRLARGSELPAAGQAARPIQGEELVRQFATDELSLLDKALTEERESFNTFRRLNTSRQEAIQARIQMMQRALAGEVSGEVRSRTTARDRLAGMDQSRMQSKVDELQQAQQKEARQFEEREAELLRRIRVLENEEIHLRGQIEESGLQSSQRQELMDAIHRREQDLALERRSRDQEREQLQAAQQALLKRIEELERPADGAAAAEPADTPRQRSPLSWLRR